MWTPTVVYSVITNAKALFTLPLTLWSYFLKWLQYAKNTFSPTSTVFHQGWNHMECNCSCHHCMARRTPWNDISPKQEWSMEMTNIFTYRHQCQCTDNTTLLSRRWTKQLEKSTRNIYNWCWPLVPSYSAVCHQVWKQFTPHILYHTQTTNTLRLQNTPSNFVCNMFKFQWPYTKIFKYIFFWNNWPI